MSQRRIKHRVVRTKNKHSRAVIRGDTIVIRLARNLTETEEREHVRDLLRRMREHVKEESKRKLIDPFRPLFQGMQSVTVKTTSGRRYNFRLNPGKRTRVRPVPGGWVIDVGPHTRRKGLHRLLWKTLADAELDRIEDLVHSINAETFQARVSEVKFRYAASQWGSCSPRRVIMLNAALLFVPPSVLRYLIIHELAHLRKPDHSPAYWREVEWAMPTYEKAIETLHSYRLPIL